MASGRDRRGITLRCSGACRCSRISSAAGNRSGGSAPPGFVYYQNSAAAGKGKTSKEHEEFAMKTMLLVIAVAGIAFAQEDFDFKSLDKLGAHAKETSNITLDPDTLSAAATLLGKDSDLSPKLKDLKSIHVRNYKYAEAGQYDPAVLAPLLAYLNRPGWKTIIDVKDGKETTRICVKPHTNGDPGGLALVSMEPTEVSVIFISGSLSLNDLGKLSDSIGFPNAVLSHEDPKADKK
jgi:hypothetical protein